MSDGDQTPRSTLANLVDHCAVQHAQNRAQAPVDLHGEHWQYKSTRQQGFSCRQSSQEYTGLCRLESQSLEATQHNLQLFDEKLAESVAALEQQGLLPELLAAGGSPPFILAASSHTSAEQQELAEYLGRSPLPQIAGSNPLPGTPATHPLDPPSTDLVSFEDADRQALSASSKKSLMGSRELTPDPSSMAIHHEEDWLRAQDSRQKVLLGHHLLDLWTGLCVCHNLITEEAEAGQPPVYQVSHTTPPLPQNPILAPHPTPFLHRCGKPFTYNAGSRTRATIHQRTPTCNAASCSAYEGGGGGVKQHRLWHLLSTSLYFIWV